MPAQVDVPDYPVASQVTVDPATTALLIVDMQNDFVRDNGKLQVPTAAATIPTIARLRDFARRHDMAVYYTQDSHERGDPEFALWGEHVLIGSDGWKIIDELSPDSGDKVFQKTRYDGFFQTKLEETLQAAGIGTRSSSAARWPTSASSTPRRRPRSAGTKSSSPSTARRR